MSQWRAWLVWCAMAVVVPAAASGQGFSVSGVVLNAGFPLGSAAVTLEPWGDNAPPAMPLVGVEIDQVRLSFVPRVVVVTPGTSVRFLNSDPLPHNVFGPDGRRKRFDLGTYPQGEWAAHRFEEEGVHVILCHVHPDMVAYVLVSKAPYRAVSDEQGRFVLDGVQPGRYRLRAWHSKRSGSTGEMEVMVVSRSVEGLRMMVPR